MSSSTVSSFVAVGLLAALCGCSSESPAPPQYGVNNAGTGTGGSTTTTGGSTGTGGSTSTGGGAGGTTTIGGSTSISGAGGAAAGSAGTGGESTAGSGGGTGDISAVKMTLGCGKAAPGDLTQGNFSERQIATSGVKDDDATGNPGPWSYDRQYFVRLPNGYDMNKAYPVVAQGPGCGGNGTNVYGLGDIADQVIKVGFSPESGINHVVFDGCFDDKEGDDSIEFEMWEGVWDLLASELCFDQNRVFISGNSSGAWWSNELGCVYAGDDAHPIRAIGPNTGGLPTEPEYLPTCSQTPMAGMWIHSTGDMTNPWDGNLWAIERAMGVNGCPGGDYAGATKEPYPIPGVADGTCFKVMGCAATNHPLVACPLDLGNEHGGHDDIANPGFAHFFGSFFAP